ncbi:MAG: glycosyltransferase family 4 protein [Methylophilaceae bacterium]
MRVLFLHQNFPGQFPHVARHLASIKDNQVFSFSQPQARGIAEVQNVVYKPARTITKGIHHYLAGTESSVLNGQATTRAMEGLKQKGFVPDIVIGHAGWGETLYVKDVFPDTKLINYFEFFYRAKGADTNFDPEFPNTADDYLRIRTKNITNLLSLHSCDAGISPTQWQKSLYPKEYQSKISVIHEGVDVDTVVAYPNASLTLSDGRVLTQKDNVITYVARNLEPYRGFHIFMRAAQEICQRRKDCHIVIVGGDDISYGKAAKDGKTYREQMLSEVNVDLSRVHFLGRVPYQTYLNVLQISSAHVYLTVPFVLSWSMLEAMAASCLVIGSDTAPVKEVIEHGKNGLLVDYFSPTDIANAVDDALNDPGKFQAIRQAARQFVMDNYTVKRSITQYMDLLQKV